MFNSQCHIAMGSFTGGGNQLHCKPTGHRQVTTNFPTSMPGPRVEPAASEVGGKNSNLDTTEHPEDTVGPSMAFLKDNKHIQRQVDDRIRELATFNEKGSLKSQGGGCDTMWIKNQVPWPQNKILVETSKNRVSYDSLSIFQWLSVFSAILGGRVKC